ncbi:DUF4190 domain-containing protein [Corynebacterium gerontici]|uniref:DUF4190 domain-containing protein n=1 Tax=Corynebacterium gerontici TaxID=2079234 RepID=A0A3G6J0T4_9CORY|nr:DUF4190 domain-containing protein [Corynebacterium gerontici]AZA11577.1 hypothetical protein CGERO_06385 [Corynebacterium gerontici]
MAQPPAPYPGEIDSQQHPELMGENKLAKWALWIAVAAGVSILLIGPFALIPALVALVLSIIALVKARKYPTPKHKRKGFAIGGLVLSIVVALISAAALYYALYSFAKCQDAPDDDAMRQCLEQEFTR